MALEVPPAFLSTCTKTVLEALLYIDATFFCSLS